MVIKCLQVFHDDSLLQTLLRIKQKWQKMPVVTRQSKGRNFVWFGK
jgi:hypothetical protein